MKQASLALMALLLMATFSAFGQGVRGGMRGTVVDEKAQPLEGVEVFVSSDVLQGPVVTFSDGRGRFRLALLPAGSYTVFLSLAGHQSFEMERLSIPIGMTVQLAVVLEETDFDETVVSSYSPLLEQGSAAVRTSISRDLIHNVPLGRTYPQLSWLGPGVVPGLLGDNPAMTGATAKENRYFLDDLEITRRLNGTVGTRLPLQFISEGEVVSGGPGAEHGGTLGGVVNLTARNGSNELRGEVYAFFSDDSLSAGGGDTAAAEKLTGFGDWDVGLGVGGRLIRDRLWFFAALNPHVRSQQVERAVYRLDDSLAQRNESSPETTTAYYLGRLDWRPSESTTITASIIGDPGETNGDHRYPPGRPSALYSVDTPWLTTNLVSRTSTGGVSWLVNFAAAVTDHLFVEARIGSNRYESERDPELASAAYNDWTMQGAFTDGVGAGVAFGGAPLAVRRADETSDQAGMALTWAASDGHELAFGGSWSRFRGDLDGGVPGAIDSLCVPASVGFFSNDPERWQSCDADGDGFSGDGVWMGARGGSRTWLHSPGTLRTWVTHQPIDYIDFEEYYDSGGGLTEDLSFYVQDSWRISDRITLMAGLRATAATLEGKGSSSMEDGLARRIDLGLEDQIQPRFGFTWDFTGEGQTKVYGHYGRYFETYPAQVAAIAWGGRVEDRYFFRYPRDQGGELTLPSLGQAGLPVNPGTLVEHLTTSASSYVADPDVEGQYQDELVAGVEYELLADVVVSVSAAHRRIGQVIESVSVDGGRTFFITNPGGCFEANPVTGEVLAEKVCYPEAERSYRGFELRLKKRYSNGWQASTSLLWSRATGNYSGLYRPENDNAASHYANLTTAWDYVEEMDMADGPLPTDRPWQFTVFGSYRWRFGLITGGIFRWMSGAPVSKLGVHPLGGLRERWVSERGSAGRTSSLSSFDLHLAYPISVFSVEVEAVLDVFNLCNTQDTVEVEQLYTFSWSPETDDDTELLNPAWRAPTRLQPPRSLRLGLRVAW